MPTNRRQLVALAACAFQLSNPIADNRLLIQLTPAGHFTPRDGRTMDVASWYIDATVAARVIERFNRRATPPVLDYEHQTLHKEANGQPAPAAGWLRGLVWRDDGLWAEAELTGRAAAMIQGGEYLYVSPVFLFDPATGEVLAIEMAAITNNPAIDDMAPLAERAAACFVHAQQKKEDRMNPLLLAILTALGLPQDTTEEAAIAACSSLPGKLEELTQLRTTLGAKDDQPALALCSALVASQKPDPAQYVPVAVVQDLQGQLAALSAEVTGNKVTALVDQGIADGKLIESQRAWATSLGSKDLAALSGYLSSAPQIAALSGQQTQGQPPAGGKDDGLTDAERAVCSATGITPEAFIAARPKTA